MYSNDPQPNPYLGLPSPLPNIDFPEPFWINKLLDLKIIACLNPDLFIAAAAASSLLKAFWSIETPSTKQIVHEVTGRSWICGAKQVIGQADEAAEVASNSNTGKFIYGAIAGFDIAAYYAFMAGVSAEGLLDFHSALVRMRRVCAGSQSKYRGITAEGGWPSDVPGPQIGPSFLNGDGDIIGPELQILTGQVGIFTVWCNFSNLELTGGVIVRMWLEDVATGQVYDSDVVNNLNSLRDHAVVSFFTTEGRSPRDMIVRCRVEFLSSLTTRAVAVTGGCYQRAFAPNASDAPPYFDMRTMLKSSQE